MHIDYVQCEYEFRNYKIRIFPWAETFTLYVQYCKFNTNEIGADTITVRPSYKI
jgi:hypothetical protein